jgi:hypothetical protein
VPQNFRDARAIARSRAQVIRPGAEISNKARRDGKRRRIARDRIEEVWRRFTGVRFGIHICFSKFWSSLHPKTED